MKNFFKYWLLFFVLVFLIFTLVISDLNYLNRMEDVDYNEILLLHIGISAAVAVFASTVTNIFLNEKNEKNES